LQLHPAGDVHHAFPHFEGRSGAEQARHAHLFDQGRWFPAPISTHHLILPLSVTQAADRGGCEASQPLARPNFSVGNSWRILLPRQGAAVRACPHGRFLLPRPSGFLNSVGKRAAARRFPTILSRVQQRRFRDPEVDQRASEARRHRNLHDRAPTASGIDFLSHPAPEGHRVAREADTP
jgi:hypothetical protein